MATDKIDQSLDDIIKQSGIRVRGRGGRSNFNRGSSDRFRGTGRGGRGYPRGGRGNPRGGVQKRTSTGGQTQVLNHIMINSIMISIR